MKSIYIFIILGIYFFWISCEDKPDSTTDSILEMAYSRDYCYPSDFYCEIIDCGSIYYENTVSIKPINKREYIWIELSTNDLNLARNWSELSNQYSSVNRNLITEKETEKYFEFKRINPNNTNDIVLSRVHKDNYYRPLMDKFKFVDTIGQFNKSNFQKSEVKELIEYLWSSGSIEFPSKVIESKINENTLYFEHFIKSITVVYGDWDLNDYIYVYANNFYINKTNGIITLKKTLIKKIIGK